MTMSALALTEQSEIQRLKALLPDELKSQVAIVRTVEVNPSLIRTEKVGKKRSAIQIDLIQWQELNVDQRNLLFWHEVARVQNQTVSRFPWEAVVLGVGLGASLLELVSQNILLLSIALTVAGLAGYQLYQRNRGERSLKEATAADQGAISLAARFGYSLPQAYNSLDSALRTLMEQTPNKAQTNRYKVRLQVLEMCARQTHRMVQSLPAADSFQPVMVAPTRRQQKMAASKLI